MADNTTTDVVILKLEIQEGGTSGKKTEEAKKEVDALATSILGLQKANKALREERKLLDTSTADGTKRIQEINAAIDKNDKTIKANSSTLEKQRLNIGNYASALDKLVPGLGGVAQGIGGMTKASYAFIATGIGAIIAAIGIALAALVSYFKSSGDGADKFAKITAQAGAVINVLVDRVSSLVRALGAFLSGDFSGGIDGLKQTFGGLGDEIEREIKLAGDLAEALDNLEDSEKDYAVALSETANQIKQLIIQSKDRSLTEQQRIDKLNEALKKEKENNQTLLTLRFESLRIATEEAAMRANLTQKENESLEQFAKRLIQNGKLADDVRDKVRESLTGVNEAVGESLNLQEKIDNQISQLEEKRQAREEKLREQRRKAEEEDQEKREELRQIRFEALENELERNHEAYLKEVEQRNQLERITTEGVARVAKIRDDQRKKDLADDKKAADAQRKIDDFKNDAIIGGIELVTKERSHARTALNFIFKADAIKETVTNTYNAAVAAYKSLAGIPVVGPALGAVAAGLVTAFGLAQVGKITGIQFAQGGRADKRGTFVGRSHAQGGEDYVNIRSGHRINVEGDENFYVLKKSASREINYLSGINQKHGGNSWVPAGTYPGMRTYANGGQIAASQGNNTNDIERTVRSIMQTMPPIYVVAQDVSEVLTVDSEIRTRAQVI